MRALYPILLVFYHIVCFLSSFPLILSWKPYIRFWVYLLNSNTSAVSCTDRGKTWRSYILFLFSGYQNSLFVFVVTICICHLKLIEFEFIVFWLHWFFYPDCAIISVSTEDTYRWNLLFWKVVTRIFPQNKKNSQYNILINCKCAFNTRYIDKYFFSR